MCGDFFLTLSRFECILPSFLRGKHSQKKVSENIHFNSVLKESSLQRVFKSFLSFLLS